MFFTEELHKGITVQCHYFQPCCDSAIVYNKLKGFQFEFKREKTPNPSQQNHKNSSQRETIRNSTEI